MTMLSMPEATASSTPYWMTGLSTRTSISFGWALVAGRNRVPSPAAGKTALRTAAAMSVIVTQVQSATCSIRPCCETLDVVRATLQNRGADLDAELEELAALETERRRLLPEVEGLKREQNTAAEEVARAKQQGLDTTAIQEANRARAQRIKQLDAELADARAAPQPGPARSAEHAARQRAGGEAADDNVEVRRHGTPRHVRLHAAGALGSRARRSASSTSSAAPRSPPRGSRC